MRSFSFALISSSIVPNDQNINILYFNIYNNAIYCVFVRRSDCATQYIKHLIISKYSLYILCFFNFIFNFFDQRE